MSWISRRPLLGLILLAFGLRAAAALATRSRPLFPAYYYTDARLAEGQAERALLNWRAGRPSGVGGSSEERAYALWLAALYRAFGLHPIAGQLANAVCAALAVAALWSACEAAFGGPAAYGAAALVCLWPSHIFFTSQNFKDAIVMLLCYLLLAAISRGASGRRSALWLTCGAAAALPALLFLRPYLLIPLAAAIVFCACASLLLRERKGTLVCAGWLSLIAALLLLHAYAMPLAGGELASLNARADVIPRAVDDDRRQARLWTPEGLSDFRRIHQQQDQRWSSDQVHRRVESQLFVGERFSSWPQVALFLPKAVFYVLFMPLPLLYPLAGKLGRQLSALENTGLVVIALAATAGLARRGLSPARALLFGFFAVAAVGSALLEFDLGSATRHRMLYMPLLFPFAMTLAVRERRKPAGGRRKVFQVLECGGPGGTGNQVAAVCNGLDPAAFEVGLVYACRDSDPEAYRKQARGARRTFYVPELVREISPLRDAKAFLRLRRIFKEERPDVVHAHSSKAGILARLAAWTAGVPLIYYSPHGYGFLQRDRGPASRALYKIAEWSISWIGTIVAVSPSEAALARSLSWGKPVETVCDPYLGPEPKENKIPHGGIVVGACGRLTAARDPQAFVALTQRLTDSRNGLRCVWIGGGEKEASVRRDLENMNLLSKVEITGWLSPEAARERLRGLDVFVHYSAWDARPNAVLEAMTFGLPVVASDIPANRDLVVPGETGLLAGGEIELLEQCLKLVDDPALRERMGAVGQKIARERFGAEQAHRALAALYSR